VRLVEFDATKAKIVSLVSNLHKRAEGKSSAKINTNSFKQMLKNIGVSIDSSNLSTIVQNSPSLGRLITSVDDDYVVLNMTGEMPMDDFDGDFGDDFADDGGMDDLGLDDGMGMDDGMGGEEVGATTDDFEDPMMQGGNGGAAAQNAVPNMAKRALSRRT